MKAELYPFNPSFWFGLIEPRLECYYQPVYSVHDHRIIGAEALVRIKDNHGGFHNTEDVIRKAEEMGWVVDIDRWIFQEVCNNIPSFRAYGIERINVNLSSHTCLDPLLVKRVVAYLKNHGIAHSEICMEITETSKTSDESQFSIMLSELERAGIRIALDDFGKGESNLLRLIEIPFSTLKLDRAFICALDNRELARPFLEAIVNICNTHNILITAEGVETHYQAQQLAAMGCDCLQGYLISKALPYDQFIRFLKDHAHDVYA